MAHQLEQMAYVGDTPWHGLGNQLTVKTSRLKFGHSRQAWTGVSSHPMSVIWHRMNVGKASSCRMKTSVYCTVLILMHLCQWSVNVFRKSSLCEILEFYRDLTEQSGFELETAGVLKGGKKFWALARTGQSTALKGKDVSNGYILLGNCM